MGDLMRAIDDDIREYVENCRAVGEKPVYDHGSPDCYGEHANIVRRKAKMQREYTVGQWLESK